MPDSPEIEEVITALARADAGFAATAIASVVGVMRSGNSVDIEMIAQLLEHQVGVHYNGQGAGLVDAALATHCEMLRNLMRDQRKG